MKDFKIWFEAKEYQSARKFLMQQVFRNLNIKNIDINKKQIKDLDEKDIEKIKTRLINNTLFDKLENKDEILSCLEFKTDSSGNYMKDKNGKKILENGNCTLSYLARSISSN